MANYLHLLTHSGDTWLSSGICISSSHTKVLSVHFTSSKRNDYLELLQFDLADMYFYSKKDSSLSFSISMLFTRLIEIPVQTISSGDTSSSEHASDLSCLGKSSLLESFGFMSVIDYFVLFIFPTILFRFLTQIANTFSGFGSSWASMGVNNCFTSYLLKAFTKAVWLCFVFVFCILLFFAMSILCLSSKFVTSLLKSG